MTATHHWETTSSHVTSAGWVRYQRCACGAVRVLTDGRNDLGIREVGIFVGAGD